MRERDTGAQQEGEEWEDTCSKSGCASVAQVSIGLGPVDVVHDGTLRRWGMGVLLRTRVRPLLVLPTCCSSCVLALLTGHKLQAERVVAALTQRHRRSLSDCHVLRYKIRRYNKSTIYSYSRKTSQYIKSITTTIHNNPNCGEKASDRHSWKLRVLALECTYRRYFPSRAAGWVDAPWVEGRCNVRPKRPCLAGTQVTRPALAWERERSRLGTPSGRHKVLHRCR